MYLGNLTILSDVRKNFFVARKTEKSLEYNPSF